VFRTISTAVNALNVVNRHFEPLLRCAGLRDIRWHDLRRTCVTLLLGRPFTRNWLSIFCIFWGTPA
jgi:hypothetical protein